MAGEEPPNTGQSYGTPEHVDSEDDLLCQGSALLAALSSFRRQIRQHSRDSEETTIMQQSTANEGPESFASSSRAVPLESIRPEVISQPPTCSSGKHSEQDTSEISQEWTAISTDNNNSSGSSSCLGTKRNAWVVAPRQARQARKGKAVQLLVDSDHHIPSKSQGASWFDTSVILCDIGDKATQPSPSETMGSEDPLQLGVTSSPLINNTGGKKALYSQKHIPQTSCDLRASRLHMGYLRSEREMVDMITFPRQMESRFPKVEIRNSEINILFCHTTENCKSRLYKICIPSAIFLRGFEVINGQNNNVSSFVIVLSNPPQVFAADLDERDRNQNSNHQPNSWSGNQGWDRVVNVPFLFSPQQTMPIALHEKYQIDFGRWTVYRIDFLEKACKSWTRMAGLLKSNGLKIETTLSNMFTTACGGSPTLWAWLDRSWRNAVTSLALLNDAEDIHLPFEVRYLLEACLSQGILHEDNITIDFLRELQNRSTVTAAGQSRASIILGYIATKSQRWWKPQEIFSDREIARLSPSQRMPDYCCLVRKAVITPTTIHFSPPSVETSHRIFRTYKPYEDRFLRVQFLDEKHKGKILSRARDQSGNDNQQEIWKRIERVFREGIRIGGRHYRFLAYGNSQLRESGALFFCDDHIITCETIREAMGSFDRDDRNPAKYAARMGQCLSTTRAPVLSFAYNLVEVPDIKQGSWCFSDGVGKIGQTLAEEVARCLQLRRRTVSPSAFQFRLGGNKGLLVVSKDIRWLDIHLRPSQAKFQTKEHRLEIIKTSYTTTATLNRQIIAILSFLGIADTKFLAMLATQLSDYEQSMTDSAVAQRILKDQTDLNGVLPAMAGMVANGFMDAREPFMLAILGVWRAWSLKQLKDKGRLTVKDGAFVFGTVDESNTLLGYHEHSSQFPQIFIQVPDGYSGRYQVITGKCIVGRNPTLHPGDIRLVEAVDVEALRHLHDLVVFPAHGDRDIPSMCSGGDLDGDEYFVIWDHDLVQIEQHKPMEMTAADALKQDRTVTISDVAEFFVNYMKNDCLGIIAHAHVATADLLDAGHAKCIELARLHSQSVDFNKTGVPAQMTKSLHPSEYPHFMEKQRKSYRSHKILGQIFDQVARVDFIPGYAHPFDARILQAFDLPCQLKAQARDLKCQYDTALRGILSEQRIATEFEVWSTFVLSKPASGTDYNRQETVGLLRCSLVDQFTNAAYDIIGSRAAANVHPFVAACYAVTSEQVRERLDQLHAKEEVASPQNMPLISFPWLFERELGIIANQAGGASSKQASGEVSTPVIVLTTESDSLGTIASTNSSNVASVTSANDPVPEDIFVGASEEEQEEEEEESIDNDAGGLSLFNRL